MQGKSPPVQDKESYGNLDMVTCGLSTCNIVYKVHLPIILTRGSGSRKNQTNTKVNCFTL